MKIIVQTLINAVACLAMLWGFWHVMHWIWPEAFWINVAFFAVLAVDMALIVSGIAPKGLRDWRKIGGGKP
jgi:hypothetical protein